MAGAQFYWGGPELTGGGQRSRRQLGALTSLATSGGKVGGYLHQKHEEREAADVTDAELQSRLGLQQDKAVQQSASAADGSGAPGASTDAPAQQTAAAQMATGQGSGGGGDDGASPTIGPTGQPSGLGSKLLSYAKYAGSMLEGPSREQKIGQARMKGTLERRQDQQKSLSAASSLMSTSLDPSKVARALAPDLNIPETPRYIPPRAANLTSLAMAAAGGDPAKAGQLVTSWTRAERAPFAPIPTEQETGYTDPVTGEPMDPMLGQFMGNKRVIKRPAGQKAVPDSSAVDDPNSPLTIHGLRLTQ